MKTFLVVLAIVAMPAMAAAQECATDQDCPEGYVCMGATCPAIACAPGQECPPCDAKSQCVEDPTPKECAADADCPSGFACKEVAEPCPAEPCMCGCPACDPDSGAECFPCDCPPCEEPPPCEPIIHHYCQYEPKECASDAECQDGFECIALEACAGGGGCACTTCACAPCDPSAGAECPPCDCPKDPPPCECPEPTEPECTVMGHVCSPKMIECKADADCPADWACVSMGVDCACPACACMEGAPDCKCEPCDCGGASDYAYCMPKGWAEGGIGTPKEAYDTAATNAGADTSTELPKNAEGSQYAAPAAAPSGESATGGTGQSQAICGAGLLPVDLAGLSLLAAFAGRLLRRRR